MSIAFSEDSLFVGNSEARVDCKTVLQSTDSLGYSKHCKYVLNALRRGQLPH